MNAIDEPLEPPGTITVIGAGTVGLEAGLYARCLGYDVTILEAEAVGQAWRDREAASAPLPFLPDRGVSRLAMTAVQTQHAASGAAPRPLPLTVSQWIEEVLEDLAASDLLAGRVHTGCRVETIQPVAIEPAIAEAGEAEGEDPALPEEAPAAADFWVSYRTEEGTLQRQQAEAVIDTTSGAGIAIQGFAATSLAGTETPDADFRTATPYFYRVPGEGGEEAEAVESALARARDQIRRLFALLGDRADLDLYRPFRM